MTINTKYRVNENARLSAPTPAPTISLANSVAFPFKPESNHTATTETKELKSSAVSVRIKLFKVHLRSADEKN